MKAITKIFDEAQRAAVYCYGPGGTLTGGGAAREGQFEAFRLGFIVAHLEYPDGAPWLPPRPPEPGPEGFPPELEHREGGQ